MTPAASLELDPAREPGESPAEYESRVYARARVRRTPLDGESSGGASMAWHEWGAEGGRPLVLLHGGFGSWRHWILNVVPLSRHYRVLCADLPGLGESDPLNGEYTADTVAAAALAGVDALLGADAQFAVTGFSFGGIIGAHVSALAGTRVRRFVAVAPGALGLTTRRPQLESLGARRDPEAVREIHRINLGRLMIKDPSRVDDLALYLQQETVRRARARSGGIPWTDAAARALERCECPIAGVWGECDWIAEEHMHERVDLFRRIQPGCPFEVIQGAGHWVMYERADRFNPVLLDILSR